MDSIWQRLGIAFTEPVRDPLWGTIMLPAEFAAVATHAEFAKLGRIMQLGPAQLAYPGATHTRRAHSFGVYSVAARLLKAVAPGADGLVSPEGARAFLLAALCHDIGHFPFAHSLKELPLTEHEALTALAATGPLAEALAAAGAEPARVAAIVDQGRSAADAETMLYRRLLSGVLDPDKLDYLNRDAWACGVPYGVQDAEFILRHVAVDDDGAPAVDERGVMAVEGLLFSKYQMYRAVYWHKDVRAATAMVKQAVIAALASGALLPDELYGLDDAGFYALMARGGRDPAGLVRDVRDGRLLPLRYEAPYDEASAPQSRAAALSERAAVERELAAAIGARVGRPVRVVVDLPEPPSFESAMNVRGSGRPFHEFASVFRPEVVGGFSRALRVLRVFVDAERELAEPVVKEYFR